MADIRYDAVTVNARATLTPEGFLRDSPIIGRAGVQVYRRADGGERREYRPPEVIFQAQTLAAVVGIPIIDKHSALINATNVRQHQVGTVLSQARQDGSNMIADIVIHDPTPVTKHGRRELSLAYGVRCDETPGVSPEGEAYDARITEITRFDHLAIVDKGRAGVAKLRLDADDAISADLQDIEILQKDDNMPTEPNPGGNGGAPSNAPNVNPPANPSVNPGSGNRGMAILRLDGIEYQVPPEVERAAVRAQEALTDANRRADSAEAERDGLRSQVSSHEAAIAQARSDGATAARARLKLEGVAAEHGVEVRTDASDRVIKETIIRKVHGDTQMNFDGRSDDYLNALFDTALATATKAKKTNEANRAAVNGAGQPGARADAAQGANVTGIRSAREARDRMLRRHAC